MTAAELQTKTKQKSAEADALRQYWLLYIEADDWLPSKRQFLVWLNMASFDIVTKAIEVCATWLNKCDQPDTAQDKGPHEAVKYTSGVIVVLRKQVEQRGGKSFEDEE